ncbi:MULTISPECIES: YbjQ family protein [Dehalococcoides]|mgnify:CR=1 FL=1|jgi:uncharacterized protein YbjQ (UPF0145 family)|uniref:UPF0145 protein cbdbA1711 n=4 Tax=Dehalococcoides mccartyi TaxID=61435 RepID=Y1711_DEHMC|nr:MULTISPECIES: YbjQ family protein [Dehalococcoides]A5FPD9.1 RecName: Full=UPF0145 protein DehaBAV1_1363 [Dehalococcoides mccartyi BAV1]Q3ZW73.1 RecName: Full=UPF0145 protein cbdbA1711 [Dehalococcoides mccartyi CBDB1]AGG07090.1 hypothetical protein dcmb_1503 [Dehalococcoides mccartyi DCMB5]AGG08619.1 hypothetical protein btf_1557 [Dehalococcoides mccartyi BTF08]AII61602.1 hypothetical protein X794_07345 [Dehalococcoides mccartyi CG5]AMU87406.1 hypothetical protein Dm11a5_1580 [Dehalococcoid
MIMTNTEAVAGHKIIKNLGLVKGNTIRAKHIGKDIMASLRSIVGGEIEEYTQMLDEARNEALKRMEADAKEKGANAIICVRFSTSAVMQNASEVMAYGTAVIVE